MATARERREDRDSSFFAISDFYEKKIWSSVDRSSQAFAFRLSEKPRHATMLAICDLVYGRLSESVRKLTSDEIGFEVCFGKKDGEPEYKQIFLFFDWDK